MLIGIDVGGTFTDGVLFEQGRIVHFVKRPTRENDLRASLLEVLDELLGRTRPEQVRRIVLGTTLITNILATGQGERTALLLMPGSGLPYEMYSQISSDLFILKGEMDFRGREIAKPDPREILNAARTINDRGIRRIAAAGKFSNRNNWHEITVKNIISEKYPHMDVTLSSQTTSQLNFPRRAVTCYYTAMTRPEWNRFADEIDSALHMRGIETEVQILKADGGTISLAASRSHPCETVFSGPAASTVGGLALTMDEMNSVVVDVGGTTTDFALILSGKPLYASRGARIENRLTHIKALAVKSIALGGDSEIWLDTGELAIGPRRRGPALCLGGDTVTVTDAFNWVCDLHIGDYERSAEGIAGLAAQMKMEAADLGEKVIEEVLERMAAAIRLTLSEWENEPAYKVWEVVNKRSFNMDRLIGVGAGSPVIVPLLARRLQVNHFIHRYGPVANALGACVARPTLAVNLHIDTQNKSWAADPSLEVDMDFNIKGNIQLSDVKQMAQQYLATAAGEMGIESYADQAEIRLEEQFNIIRGWDQTGKIFDVGLQIIPGFISEYKGVAE